MNYRTRIKMCGTTTIEDANAAVQLGVDALGFIFAAKSPRYIIHKAAKQIIDELPPFLFKVGVFVNETQQEIEEVVQYLGLNGVQLHGNEDPGYCESLASSIPSCSVIKAFRVGEHSSSSDFAAYNHFVDGFLLDTYVKGVEGGTGVSFDWELLKKLHLMHPVILAGGLGPDNIKEALETASPFGVDVNSGVEFSPGVKDHARLVQFVENVVQYDRSRSGA